MLPVIMPRPRLAGTGIMHVKVDVSHSFLHTNSVGLCAWIILDSLTPTENLQVHILEKGKKKIKTVKSLGLEK